MFLVQWTKLMNEYPSSRYRIYIYDKSTVQENNRYNTTIGFYEA